MGGGRGGLPDTKSGWHWGVVAVSVRLKPYYQTSAWDGAPTVLHCLSLCLTVLRCNMQASRIKAVLDNGAGAAPARCR